MDPADLATGSGVAAACHPCLTALGCDPSVALALALGLGLAVQLARLYVPALIRYLRKQEKSNADT